MNAKVLPIVALIAVAIACLWLFRRSESPGPAERDARNSEATSAMDSLAADPAHAGDAAGGDAGGDAGGANARAPVDRSAASDAGAPGAGVAGEAKSDADEPSVRPFEERPPDPQSAYATYSELLTMAVDEPSVFAAKVDDWKQPELRAVAAAFAAILRGQAIGDFSEDFPELKPEHVEALKEALALMESRIVKPG